MTCGYCDRGGLEEPLALYVADDGSRGDFHPSCFAEMMGAESHDDDPEPPRAWRVETTGGPS